MLLDLVARFMTFNWWYQGRKNRLPGRLGQVYFHARLVLIADHLPAQASGLLRQKFTKYMYAHA